MYILFLSGRTKYFKATAMKTHTLIFTFLFTALFVLLAHIAHADTINIPDDYQTIQAGIDASSDADTVLVQPGTYYENINFNGKNIVLGSLFITTQDTSYISKTVIDGNANGHVVAFKSFEDSTTVLSGFTITNGYAKVGGGILCYSNPMLKYLNINNNVRDRSLEYEEGEKKLFIYNDGGGVCIVGGNPFITNVFIHKNKGAGIFVTCNGVQGCGETIIENSTVQGNEGYGIISLASASIMLKNVEVCENSSGINCTAHYASIYMENGTISGNKSIGAGVGEGFIQLNNVIVNDNGTGLSVDLFSSINIIHKSVTNNIVGIRGIDGQYRIMNSIVWDNISQEIENVHDDRVEIIFEHSNLKGGTEYLEQLNENDNSFTYTWPEGNINADPLFIDPENGDFRLNPESPCIDAGADFIKIDGRTYLNLSSDKYHGSAPDMGAIESDYQSTFIEDLSELPSSIQHLQNFPNLQQFLIQSRKMLTYDLKSIM